MPHFLILSSGKVFNLNHLIYLSKGGRIGSFAKVRMGEKMETFSLTDQEYAEFVTVLKNNSLVPRIWVKTP